MNLNLLKIFVKVAELGSFTSAAKKLNQPKSNVSRAISRIEADLNVQLFKRTTRKISLTLAGNQFYQSIHPLLSKLSDELTNIRETQQKVSGLIRLTTSQDIAQTILSRILKEFMPVYPDVIFETIISNDFLDLTSENIDLAFRAGRLKDSNLVQRKLMKSAFILVCSPDYGNASGIPKNISALNQHRFLSFRGMESKVKTLNSVSIKPVITSDSIPALLSLTQDGLGITMLPDYFCSDLLFKRQLVRVCPEWSSVAEPIQIVFPSVKNIPKRVRIFSEFALKFGVCPIPG